MNNTTKKSLSDTYYTKSISINKIKDKVIYDYIKEIEKTMNIASYVRELIKADMKKNENIIENNDENKIKHLIDIALKEKFTDMTKYNDITDNKNIEKEVIIEDLKINKSLINTKKKIPLIKGICD